MRKSTEHERTLVGAYAGRHPDTVKRFVRGARVAATTRQAVEDAACQLGYQHIIEERLRALEAKGGQP